MVTPLDFQCSYRRMFPVVQISRFVPIPPPLHLSPHLSLFLSICADLRRFCALSVFSRTDFSHPIYLAPSFYYANELSVSTKEKGGRPIFVASLSFWRDNLSPSNGIDWFLSRRWMASSFFSVIAFKWATRCTLLPIILLEIFPNVLIYCR